MGGSLYKHLIHLCYFRLVRIDSSKITLLGERDTLLCLSEKFEIYDCKVCVGSKQRNAHPDLSPGPEYRQSGNTNYQDTNIKRIFTSHINTFTSIDIQSGDVRPLTPRQLNTSSFHREYFTSFIDLFMRKAEYNV